MSLPVRKLLNRVEEEEEVGSLRDARDASSPYADAPRAGSRE